MKVAVFHNFMDNIGGAEQVSLILARKLKADIYTTNIDKDKIERMGFADILPRIFSIGRIPLNAPWRQQLALWRFRRLNLRRQYDFFIIAGDWAISAAVKNKPNLWYVHSPIREIWDLRQYVRDNTVCFHNRLLFDIWVLLNRHLNRKYVKAVGTIVCNSDNTRKRVEKYLKRAAVVINPPTEVAQFPNAKSRGYWLSVNRLIRHKRVDIQLRAFSKLSDEQLIIVGSYEQSAHFLEYVAYCQKEKPANVTIQSWVTKEELSELYANCKGFITTAQDEDFGMNVVEAMAAGKPVIAPNEGGYKETVINGQTGILLEAMNEDTLQAAVLKLGKELDSDPEKYALFCQAQAKRFDTAIFIEKIREMINSDLVRTL